MILSAYVVPHPPIILPEIGKGEEQKIKNTSNAYHRIAKDIAEKQPETIVIISPHAPSYLDYIHIASGESATGDFGKFHHPEIQMSAAYDQSFISKLCYYTKRNHIDAGTRGEQTHTLDHGVMIPLYFINQYYQDYEIVHISVSGLSANTHDEFGQCIAAAAEDLDRDIVIIASGDLSHKLSKDTPYGYAKEGVLFDEQTIKAFQQNDLEHFLTMEPKLIKKAAQCGLPAFQMLCGALRDCSFISDLLSYEHPFGIGYAICAFAPTEEDLYLALARNALSTYLKDHQILHLEEIPADMKQRAGVFVSFYKGSALRGCLGSIHPYKANLADEIIRNAIQAGTKDPRFPPITQKELTQLHIRIDILSALEPVFFIDELNPKKYGLLVTSGEKQSILLPNLKGIDTPEQQVAMALQKAGIDSNDYYTMERFQVTRHT